MQVRLDPGAPDIFLGFSCSCLSAQLPSVSGTRAFCDGDDDPSRSN